jgi:hypothetical protein
MSSINGFGTTYYGWRHFDDGTATATKWMSVSWLPIFPLHRQRLRVLTDFKKNELKAEAGGLFVSQVDRFEFLEKLPLSAKEVGITLGKTYLGFPALVVVPMLVLAGVLIGLHYLGVNVSPEAPVFTAFIAATFLVLIHFLWRVVLAIRQARGWQPINGSPGQPIF